MMKPKTNLKLVSRSSLTLPGDDGLLVQAAARVPIYRREEVCEWLGFVPLYRDCILGDLSVVQHGARDHVTVNPADLFLKILILKPEAFFLFHNHPSGSLEPSSLDRDLTRRVREVASRLGVRLLGHAIVTSETEHWIVV